MSLRISNGPGLGPVTVRRRRSSVVDRYKRLFLAKSFVPKILIESVNKIMEIDPRFNLQPHSLFFEAIVLIVDISGFTRLSGQYCARGKEGLDDLQMATNGFIGQLVEVIYHYGGDIIKFAGDAIICVFYMPELQSSYYSQLVEKHAVELSKFSRSHSRDMGDFDVAEDAVIALTPERSVEAQQELLSSSTLPNQAMRCAIELSRAQTDQLTVHVGLSAGEVCYAIMGGHQQQWESLISGECVMDIACCLDDAKSREVVATPSFMKLIGDHVKSNVTLTPLHSGNYRVSMEVVCSEEIDRERSMRKMSSSRDVLCDSAIMLQQLVKFVPFPIIQSLQSEFQHLAELRKVSTMFMRWDGYDTSEHRDLMKLQSLFEISQEILSEAGGFIRQFLVDDKGCVLIACWGVPTASYVDNSFRALRTAIELRNAFLAKEFQTSIGITTGTVYCGTIGSYIRREYAAIGDVVNLSARLMGKAAGSILIDEATFNSLPATASRRLQKLAPIMVKGKTEAIQIYQYTSKQLLVAEQRTSADYMIREAHRHILLNELGNLSFPGFLVRGLSRKSSKSLTPSPTAGKLMRRQSSFARLFSSTDSTCRVLLVEGVKGAGKASLVRWYRKEIEKRDISHKSIVLSAADQCYEYRTAASVFYKLFDDSFLLDLEYQRKIVLDLINTIYPPGQKNNSLNRQNMLASMKVALNISTTITLSDEQSNTRSLLQRMRSVHDSSSDVKDAQQIEIEAALQLILTELFRHEHGVFIIENIHYADEKSLEVLEAVTRMVGKIIFLFTALDLTGNVMIGARSSRANTEISDGLYSSSVPNDLKAYRSFRTLIGAYQRSLVIHLTSFEEAEIEAILGSVLGQKVVQRDIVQLISRMSKGSAYWVYEMVEFVLAIGVDEFMAAMNEGREYENEDDHKDDCEVQRFVSTAAREALEDDQSDEEVESIVSKNELGASKNGNETQLLRNHGEVQLHTLIICRFELLDADEQQFLKIASVLGVHIDAAILHRILPTRLQNKVITILTSLIEAHWLRNVNNEHGKSLYQFSNELPRRTIYELIPSSSRITLHRHVAEAIESNGLANGDMQRSLASHYRHFDDEKALQAYCTAAQLYIEVDQEWEKSYVMLKSAVRYCKCVTDCEVLLKLVVRARLAMFMKIIDEEAKACAFTSKPSKTFLRTISCVPLLCGAAQKRVTPCEQSNSGGKSSRSRGSMAHGTINRRTATKIGDRLKSLEVKLDNLREMRIKDGNVQRPADWQRRLLEKEKVTSVPIRNRHILNIKEEDWIHSFPDEQDVNIFQNSDEGTKISQEVNAVADAGARNDDKTTPISGDGYQIDSKLG